MLYNWNIMFKTQNYLFYFKRNTYINLQDMIYQLLCKQKLIMKIQKIDDYEVGIMLVHESKIKNFNDKTYNLHCFQ